MDDELKAKFWARVKKGCPNDCWFWTRKGGTKNRGTVWIGGTKKNPISTCASRAAWIFTFGDPGKLHVLHHCDVERCVNPRHLFLGTHKKNMEDMVRKRRHAFGERNGHARLTVAAVREIRHTPRIFGSGKDLARKFRVSPMTISDVRRGATWRLVA